MPFYSQGFQVECATNIYPTEARTWDNLNQIVQSYEEFVSDCSNFDQKPIPLWVYIGTPDGDEEIYGYPDWPDYIIRIGPRKNIIVDKV